MRYHLLIWKRRIEDLFILPFVAWGRWRATHEEDLGEYDIWFFFPFWHTGGAEKVHAQLANAFPDRKAIIIFTRQAQNEGFRSEFERSGHKVLDISRDTDDRTAYWRNLVMRGRISHWIRNQSKSCVVLNGQCNFAYKISRWLPETVPQIELIHSLSSFSYIRIPFLNFYTTTVMISRNRIMDHLNLYERYGIPRSFGERILYIGNGILLPQQPLIRLTQKGYLHIVYAGRGTEEKRVYLVDDIARASRSIGLPVKVSYLGAVDEGLRNVKDVQDRYYGNVSDFSIMDEVYRSADILMITSTEEGFPMVVMEAMARGCAIIATPVGDIPIHVAPYRNGWLFSNVHDEKKIVLEGVQFLQQANKEPELLEKIQANNMNYASLHFGIQEFEQHWRLLIESMIKIVNP
jgi:glycosyltransferase involved in cell wall biosynthesis